MKGINLSLLFITLCCLFSCKEAKKPPTGETKFVPDSNNITIPHNIPANPYADVDRSPMDMSYFPVDYPQVKMTNITAVPPLIARVIYSRPQLQKRHLFRDLLKYNEPWRLGANESTEIDFYKPVTIQEKKIEPGRYIIYCIPHLETWTLVLNSNIDSWGLHQDSTKDVHRFTIPIASINTSQEYFTMVFEKSDDGADLVITWDNLLARLPFKF
ncbi:MAG: DUF2911 domain-containing protein [Chitinophagaceae bacterium]